MNFDDPDRSLESQLRGIPLREPDASLDDRLNTVFAQHRFHQPRWTTFARLAIAACLLIGVGFALIASLHRPAPPIAASVPKPGQIRMERDTSTLYDEGVIVRNDDTYQQYRRRTVREIFFIDPATHAHLQVTIPTEQVLIQKLEAF